MSTGAEWLQAQAELPAKEYRKSTMQLLDELRDKVGPGVYEVSNSAGGAPHLYLRVEKIRKVHSPERISTLTWIWILAGAEEIPAKSMELQGHLLESILENGRKISV